MGCAGTTGSRLAAGDVSVVVPVGGAAPAWGRAAASLARLDPAPGEIVAVIDGPSSGLEATAAGVGARTLVLPASRGPAAARNRGARAARGEIVLFLDADVEAPPELVAEVVEQLSGGLEPAAVFGSYDDSPADPGLVSQYRNLLHHYVHQTGRERASTFWAGCGAVRRAVFVEAGGFDERYAEPSVEDIELGARLIGAGHAIRLAKTLRVKHLKRWRLGDVLATDLFRRAVPWTELMLGEGRLVNDLNVKTRDRLSVVVACLPPVALAAAWRWPALAAIVPLAAILLVALNAGLFGFFARRRGAGFAAAALPLYWLYLLSCGVGFGLGALRHLLGRRR